MTASILSLLAIGAAILWWWLQRQSNPAQQNRERYQQIDLDIARKDSQGATAHSSLDLDELERLERLRDKGPGGS
jgi:hypothetical protein